MDWIRAHGRLPRENTRAKDEEGRAECKVAVKLRRMRASLREEVEKELATLREKDIGALEELVQEADPLSGSAAVGSLSVAPQHAVPEPDEVMDFIRAHNRLPRRQPKAKAAADWEAEDNIFWTAYNNARTRNRFTAGQQEELRDAQASQPTRTKELDGELRADMPRHPVPLRTVAEVACITTNRSTDLIGVIKEVGTNKRKCEGDEEIADGEIVGNPVTPGAYLQRVQSATPGQRTSASFQARTAPRWRSPTYRRWTSQLYCGCFRTVQVPRTSCHRPRTM